MDEKEIRKYAKLMEELNLKGLEIKENGKEIRLERSESVQVAGIPSYSANGDLSKCDSGLFDVRSPMVGIFHKAVSENEKPFVSVGDHVKKGDVLCIIEAMKLMNEITAEHGGVITEICVSNKQVVDFGHILFRIRGNDA